MLIFGRNMIKVLPPKIHIKLDEKSPGDDNEEAEL